MPCGEQGGVVQGFTGDGIMAVFGAPVAFEDAPLRACRAALAILQKLKAAGPDLEVKYGVRPHLRIGLNTGTAVVGAVQQGTDGGVTVLGDTVNFASRLQTLAEPDAVLMSEGTHRLVQGMVEATFSGEHQIKGKSEPQKVYRLRGIRAGATRFERRSKSRSSQRSLGANVNSKCWTVAYGGARRAAHSRLVAEPGIGKSRLLHEFRQRISKDGPFVLFG